MGLADVRAIGIRVNFTPMACSRSIVSAVLLWSEGMNLAAALQSSRAGGRRRKLTSEEVRLATTATLVRRSAERDWEICRAGLHVELHLAHAALTVCRGWGEGKKCGASARAAASAMLSVGQP